ncbi:MAG: ABC transporter substrate-binding protein [Desulfobacterales bacterium]|nr:ABC transporter substrate-binding protein [Desulfobacterales bacterium]
MERKRFRKLVVPILTVAVLVIALPSVAVSGPAGLTEDEMVLLSHLPDQQIGKKYPKGETINVGFLAALSGPDAGWGLPGVTGNTIWIDAVNKTGGLLVGGKRYPLKMYEFDDEANASKALQGARQLVLEHDVKFISAIGGDPANATAPFLTKNKVIYASLVPTDMQPSRPYVVAGGDVTPQCNMFNALVAKMVLPSEKELGRPLKYALTTQDDIMSRQVGAWEIGAAISMGFEIVYEKFFSVDTTDFAPIITAVMASKPDVISLCEAWPEYQTMMWEQLYLQGYKGVVVQNYADWETNLTKIPAEYPAARFAIDSFPLMDDPWWGETSWQASFTRIWNASYGPGAPKDVKRKMTGIDWDHVVWLIPWCIGAQIAGEETPGKWPSNDAILAALRKLPSFPTILGPGHMSGKEMFGIENMIEQPVPMNMFDLKAGDKRIIAHLNFEPWFGSIKKVVIKAVKERGQHWSQRK